MKSWVRFTIFDDPAIASYVGDSEPDIIVAECAGLLSVGYGVEFVLQDIVFFSVVTEGGVAFKSLAGSSNSASLDFSVSGKSNEWAVISKLLIDFLKLSETGFFYYGT
jgi:hypothetical protein